MVLDDDSDDSDDEPLDLTASGSGVAIFSS
jgi:hypothetical protein